MSSTRPKVSVLCPTYNHVNFIHRCVEGIVSQNVDFDIEIIVGDDGSTDGTTDILRRLEATYPSIVVVGDGQNRGVYKNIIGLLARARGYYIALCEGDDYWTDRDKLRRQVEILDSDSSIYGTYHSVTRITENDTQIGLHPKDVRTYFSCKEFLEDFYRIPTCSVVCRNIFFEKTLFAYRDLLRDHRFIWDYILDVLILEQGRYVAIDHVMGAYRITHNTNSFTSQAVNLVEDEMLSARRRAIKWVGLDGTSTERRNIAMVRLSIISKYRAQAGSIAAIRRLVQYDIKSGISIIFAAIQYIREFK